MPPARARPLNQTKSLSNKNRWMEKINIILLSTFTITACQLCHWVVNAVINS